MSHFKRILCVLPIVISGCGGGGGGSGLDANDGGGLNDGSDSPFADVCRTDSLDAIVGFWDGQITYDGRRGMCVWEMEATIGNEVTAGCERPGAITASVVSAAPTEGNSCGEIGVGAAWQTTSSELPATTLAVLDVAPPDGPIYPNGRAGFGTGSVRFVITPNVTMEFAGDEEWRGVLVKE